MPIVSFAKKQFSSITVETGASLMQSLIDIAHRPVASSCGGEGVCAKCKIQITAGAENLSAKNQTEIFLAEVNNLASDVRISCQTQILGDIEVDASYW